MKAQSLRRSRDERLIANRALPLERALRERDVRRKRVTDIWELSRTERLAAFEDGRLSFRQCLEWARRAPREVPLAADGEFLFIACRTPEWMGD